MPTPVHDHAHACDCVAHRHPAPATGGLWATLLPVLACAVCPACLSAYAKLFSVVGVGFGLSEEHHTWLLSVAITLSVSVSAFRTFRTRRVWPLGIALFGSGLVALGHLLGDIAWLEWAGVFTLLAGGLTEHFRLRRAARLPLHVHS